MCLRVPFKACFGFSLLGRVNIRPQVGDRRQGAFAVSQRLGERCKGKPDLFRKYSSIRMIS